MNVPFHILAVVSNYIGLPDRGTYPLGSLFPLGEKSLKYNVLEYTGFKLIIIPHKVLLSHFNT